MSRALPYFRWYPADAEIDEDYAALNDTELGFFHRCLNRAWMNDGLPSDMDRLAITMKVTRKYLDRLWPAVAKCFTLTDTVIPRYVNSRQEQERELALEKSRKSSSAVAVREVRRKSRSSSDVSSDVSGVLSSDTSKDHPRAYGSGSGSNTKKEEPRKSEVPSRRFSEFWAKYPVKENRPIAEGVFVSIVTTANEAAVFACLDRYTSSDRGARSPKNPANWLHDCSRDNWESDWPKARDNAPAPPPSPIYKQVRCDAQGNVIE